MSRYRGCGSVRERGGVTAGDLTCIIGVQMFYYPQSGDVIHPGCYVIVLFSWCYYSGTSFTPSFCPSGTISSHPLNSNKILPILF